jgi:hypothetical protein
VTWQEVRLIMKNETGYSHERAASPLPVHKEGQRSRRHHSLVTSRIEARTQRLWENPYWRPLHCVFVRRELYVRHARRGPTRLWMIHDVPGACHAPRVATRASPPTFTRECNQNAASTIFADCLGETVLQQTALSHAIPSLRTSAVACRNGHELR